MSRLRQLMRQEIRAREQFVVGTTLQDPEYKAFDNSSNPVWVSPAVDINSNVPLRNIPIKAINGSRAYAARGGTVLLRRSTQGRFEIVAPGDRLSQVRVRKTYSFGNTTPTSTVNFGFSFRREVFDFYKGLGPPNSLWNDGVTPFPKITVIDAQGNEVT